MSLVAAAGIAGTSGWTVFWIQLPVLVLAVAVAFIGTTAVRRSRPEDVPKVFAAFASAFGVRRGDRLQEPSPGVVQNEQEEGNE